MKGREMERRGGEEGREGKELHVYQCNARHVTLITFDIQAFLFFNAFHTLNYP